MDQTKNAAKVYQLRMPLYVNPSSQFKKFIEDIGNPVQHLCLALYWQGKLRFSAASLPKKSGELGREVFLQTKFIEDCKLSSFATRFNAMMAIKEEDREIKIEILDLPCKGATKQLRVYCTVYTLAGQLVLENICKGM